MSVWINVFVDDKIRNADLDSRTILSDATYSQDSWI